MRYLVPLLLTCALATSATADGIYFTESFGGADVKDQLGERIDGAGRVRVSLGYRRRSLALELWGGVYLGNGHTAGTEGPCGGCAARSDEPPSSPSYGHSPSALGAYGLDLKYLRPVSRRIDVYLRGGMSAIAGQVQGDDYAGRGLGIGAGAQLKGKVRALGFLWWPLFFTGFGPKVTAALWADAGLDFYRLHRGGRAERGPSLDARMTTMSFGFAVGTDF